MGMFSYNADFYPTPVEVIERMMVDEDVTGKVVLEPSAGKGDIVEWLWRNGAKDVIACEKDVQLLPYLMEKCRVVGFDFLQLRAEEVSHVQMIVMNPPFSEGIKHIRHAWEIAPAGCTIVALCNHANFSSYYRATESLDEIVTDNGYRESLGCVFKNAERHTDVEVELVKLFKHGEGGTEFDGYFFEGYDADAMGSGEEGLTQYNLVRDLVQRYKTAVELFDQTMAAAQEINRVALWKNAEMEKEPDYYNLLPIRFDATRTDSDNRRTGPVTHAEYRKELQKFYWKIIFRKMNMEKYATQKLREDINRYVEANSARPFTMANVYRVLNIVVQTTGNRMQKAVEEAFDLICSLSAENSTAGEKWKTNANYMVNRRFICDWITEIYCGRMSIRWSSHNDHATQIDDVTKALCYMTGRDWNEIGELRSYVNGHDNELEWGKWFEWGFFRCRGYKKGTMHFEFLDEAVWAKFNQTVAQARGWHIGSRGSKKAA